MHRLLRLNWLKRADSDVCDILTNPALLLCELLINRLYLKGIVAERQRKESSIHWFASLMAAMARARLDLRQELSLAVLCVV